MSLPTRPSAIVWFKRDLRVRDHAPLLAACESGRPLGLFILEPEWLASPECDLRHVQFTLGCLASLRADLAERGVPLLVRVGSACSVLSELHQALGGFQLWSHEETGSGWSYARDLAVADWCRARGVVWQEVPQTGVIRRLRSRTGWADRWQSRMDAPVVRSLSGLSGLSPDAGPLSFSISQPDLPSLADLGLEPDARARDMLARLQAPGESAAWSTLKGFLEGRAVGYRKAMSSPLTGEQGCSRMSAYLSFGCISMRSVHQATERAMSRSTDGLSPAAPIPGLAYGLGGFRGRLRWHCHFMQKLEDEPRIEFENFSRAYDGLRESDFDASRFQAWAEGRTGYPMVDACMRFLRATGWLNFRMRAMLVSFASQHLWLHWRPTGLHLARQFLDFEPGIHWSQMQMQSGTTGINTMRIYSPTKQAQDQDPEGVFLRRWLPELAQVPLSRLAQPWTMSPAEQQSSGCRIGLDYPEPIVDEKLAMKAAKDRLSSVRRSALGREESERVLERHGSRKGGLPQTPSSRRRRVKTKTADASSAAGDPAQPELF